jgi:hypothetical protein
VILGVSGHQYGAIILKHSVTYTSSTQELVLSQHVEHDANPLVLKATLLAASTLICKSVISLVGRILIQLNLQKCSVHQPGGPYLSTT